MKSRFVQEAVVAAWGRYSEKVLTDVPYDQALKFCKENGWKVELHGKQCKLKIVRDDSELTDFPEHLKSL